MPYAVVPGEKGGGGLEWGRGGGEAHLDVTGLHYLLAASYRLGFSHSHVEPALIKTPLLVFLRLQAILEGGTSVPHQRN